MAGHGMPCVHGRRDDAPPAGLALLDLGAELGVEQQVRQVAVCAR